MSGAPRPNLTTARAEGDEIVVSGDGVDLIRMPARSALWLIGRLSDALLERPTPPAKKSRS